MAAISPTAETMVSGMSTMVSGLEKMVSMVEMSS